jgi:murein DD-endopeptidase MepM/ murein hydrolase activator NlpD
VRKQQQPPPRTSWLVFAASLGFLAGMLVMAAVVTIFPSGAAVGAPIARTLRDGVGIVTTAPLAAAEPKAPEQVKVRPSLKETPPAVSPPEPELKPNETVTAMSADTVAELRGRGLTLPVQGIKREELRDTFNEKRGASRRHEAIDILAPRNTPVFAVEDGEIAKLFVSAAGGITIYQFDPDEDYVYYYAHLERYAEGLEEGDDVKRGQIIGYVGTTGNAPRDTPHLHFAIFKMTDDKRWWQGTPIDPYSVLR